MTKTFSRFLRSFSDEELAAFIEDRAGVRPPYWRALRLALRIEIDRRNLTVDEDLLGPVVSADPEVPLGRVTA